MQGKEKSGEDFDYDRYKRLLAEATDEPKRIALIDLLIKERAHNKLTAERVKQQVAQFVGSRDTSVGTYSVAISPAEFIVEDELAQRVEGEELDASSKEAMMKKPGKTAAELEAMIKVEMEAISDQPIGTIVSVQPNGESWTAHAVSESSVDDCDLHDMITQIADRLKAEFNLSK
jgi:hypothetical protein